MIRQCFALGAVLALNACAGALDAHLNNFYRDATNAAGATPSPGPSPTGSAAGCSPGVSTPTASVIIDMASGIGIGTSAAGPIAGYLDNSVASLVQSQPITVPAGRTVQFWNIDQARQLRSAIGIRGTTFPAIQTFDASRQAQSGSTIDASAAWSTGLIPYNCYSQPLTVAAPGTYLFGDFTGYGGVAGLRDLIVSQ